MIEKYLLEKTRVVHQIQGERNYHIFYQMIHGASQNELDKRNLQCAAAYCYLNDGLNTNSADDNKEFQETMECLRNIGLDTNQIDQIFDLLAAVLHLGNVEFDENDGDGQVKGVKIECTEALSNASSLLGVTSEDFLNSMIKQNMFVQGATIIKNQSNQQVSIDRK
jgi:myosin heavy subunit